MLIERNRQNRMLSDDIVRISNERKEYEAAAEKELSMLRTQTQQQARSIEDLLNATTPDPAPIGNQTESTGQDHVASEEVPNEAHVENQDTTELNELLDEMTLDQIEGRDNPDDIYPLLQSETIQDYIQAIRELEDDNAELAYKQNKGRKKYKALRKKYNTLQNEHTDLQAAYDKLDKKKTKKIIKEVTVQESIDFKKLKNLLQGHLSEVTTTKKVKSTKSDQEE